MFSYILEGKDRISPFNKLPLRVILREVVLEIYERCEGVHSFSKCSC